MRQRIRKTEAREDARELVLAALEDSRYEWRTIPGIAQQTSLPSPQVRKIVEEASDIVVRSAATDERGRALYTTRKHYRETHGFASRLLSALSDRIA